jgi:DNA polymerase III subunit beta
MKLICTQENLNRAISYLERVTGKQTNLPILGNFLLETEKGRLKISATNLEIGVVVYIGAKIEREGRIAIPSRVLANFIHNLPSGDVVDMEVSGQVMRIVSTAHQVNIKGVDGKDFPIIPQYKKEYPFALPAQELKEALSRLLFCVSVNESRLELTGVNIFFFQDAIHLAATDSFRLAEEIIPLIEASEGYQDFIKENQSLIIPNNTLQEVIRVITQESSEVKMSLQENQVFFEVDGVQIISRSINGKYPDYKQIIPQSFVMKCVLGRDDLQRAIRIASAFSSYDTNEVTLVFDPKRSECSVASISREVGENKTVLKGEFLSGNDPLTIVFNPRYVADGLNACTGGTVMFFANTGTTPAALRMMDGEKEKEGYLYIMMPIRK